MRNFIFGLLLWTVGMTFIEDNIKAENPIMDNVRARGRCRKIFRDRRNVVIQFLNEEDAELFAKDLHEYLNK